MPLDPRIARQWFVNYDVTNKEIVLQRSGEDPSVIDVDEAKALSHELWHAAEAATSRPTPIGDVIVVIGWPVDGNPYKESARRAEGQERVDALVAFNEASDTSRYTFWHAPAHGGARQIKDARLIDWRGLR